MRHVIDVDSRHSLASVKESGKELRGMQMLDWREECAD